MTTYTIAQYCFVQKVHYVCTVVNILFKSDYIWHVVDNYHIWYNE